VVVAGCFLGAAGLSVAEVSLLRVRRSQAEVGVEEGDPGARRLLALLDDLPVVLHAVLLLALLFQVSTAMATGLLAQRWLGDLGITVATVATTVVLFLYAEAVPKTMAMRSPYRMARGVAGPVALLVAILRPMVRFLVWLADRQIPGPPTPGTELVDEAEFRNLARQSADAGVIGEGDAELLERSFEFNDRKVGEVMVARSDIAAAPATTSLEAARELAVTAGHRRLPVYGTDLDDVIGVARFRDVVASATAAPTAPLSSVASPVLRCGPDVLISALATRMQEHGQWLAIVTGPGGHTLGLVTIEDVVAELVGEISEDGVLRPRPGGGEGKGTPP